MSCSAARAGSQSRCSGRISSSWRSTSRAACRQSRFGRESTSATAPRGPLLDGSLGWLECELAGEHEAGDHTLFVGRVERVEPGAPGTPLIRLGGDYQAA